MTHFNTKLFAFSDKENKGMACSMDRAVRLGGANLFIERRYGNYRDKLFSKQSIDQDPGHRLVPQQELFLHGP